MNITIVTPTFPYPNRGNLYGSERYIENLALNLQKLGHDIKIITSFKNGGKKYGKYQEMEILRVKDLEDLLGGLGRFFFLHYITFGLNLFRKKHFKFFRKSDLILLNLPILFTNYFKLKKIPFISIFFHYIPIKSSAGYLSFPVYHYLERKQYHKSNGIATISENSKLELIKHYRIRKQKIQVFPIGIDTNKFNPGNYRKELSEKYGSPLLLYSGLMVYRKRISVLIRAMVEVVREIPSIHLVLTGEGPYLPVMKKLVKSFGLEENVTFYGFAEDDVLTRLYASSDLFIFPSELEGFGQVILEAMASGTPVICANKPPMSSLIENAGYTFIVNDPIDLSKKIILILKDRVKLSQMKQNALKLAKKYEWIQIAKLYDNYLKNFKPNHTV